MKMQEIMVKNIPVIHQLCDAHHVKELFAFGSVCTDQFTSTSDIDLLVAFKPLGFEDYSDNYFELAEKLEQALNRPIDLITDKSLSNPYFIKSLERTKTKLYG
ncbi:MAG: nucleotidyltransferase domain-containing protein [Bacteroidales bacterium]|nr:nucleotidyltransferase domain-containing protein [Bacteroidales bacterium]